MMDWKAGELAMVEIDSPMSEGWTFIRCKSGGMGIATSCLRPLPPAMTKAEAALVEACIRLRHTIPYDRSDMPGRPGLADLVDAVLAERAPPDPWRALEQVIDQVESSYLRARIRDALDAAKGEKS